MQGQNLQEQNGALTPQAVEVSSKESAKVSAGVCASGFMSVSPDANVRSTLANHIMAMRVLWNQWKLGLIG